MPLTRRDFLRSAAASTGTLGAFSAWSPAFLAAPRREPMDLLILGGTVFLGPHLVEAALARGHKVTLFNRGRSNPGIFPDLEKLKGDRDPNKGEGLSALEGRKWDAVIDTSGYVPRVVKASAELLADSVSQYLFISTLSVYAEYPANNDESSPVGKLEDETVEEITGETYGPLKALCEQAAEAAMPGRVANVRPGLIVGPLDRSDRFNYWPVRVDRGGEILAPGRQDNPVQIIDARDLAQWCILLLENQTHGVFNAIGPPGVLTMAELLHGCKVVVGSDCSFTWVPDAFLLDQGVGQWMELPLWIAEEPPYGLTDFSKAVAAGLTFRPTGDTIRDTLAWCKTRPEDHRWRAGMDPEKEARVLQSWHDSQQSG